MKDYSEDVDSFANSDCRFSHGHKTTLTSLRVYKEPDYKEFKKGRSCLAKKSSGIWSRGIINQIEDGIRCTVRFVTSSHRVFSAFFLLISPNIDFSVCEIR